MQDELPYSPCLPLLHGCSAAHNRVSCTHTFNWCAWGLPDVKIVRELLQVCVEGCFGGSPTLLNPELKDN